MDTDGAGLFLKVTKALVTFGLPSVSVGKRKQTTVFEGHVGVLQIVFCECSYSKVLVV